MLNFSKQLAQNLNISSNGTHLAIVQFSDRPQLEFGLNIGSNAQTIKFKIGQISYINGGTNIGRALLFTLSRAIIGMARNNSDRIVVVVTDGVSTDDVVEPAINLRLRGNAKLIAIGIGQNVDQQQLNMANSHITDDPRKVYTLKNFDQLNAGLVTRSIQNC
uniref:VWFA domain-containing protein n=1 Tax=Globodera pallida TaxID=36090 RepID=A0A183BMM8_GLOPA